MRSGKIYLGRAGRIFGPYAESDLARKDFLPDGLTLDDMRWIWDGAGGWRPIEEPPPEPGKTRRGGKVAEDGVLQALCVDRAGVVAGVLTALSESGCRLETPDPSASPPFAVGGSLMMNLLDPATNRSINLKVTFAGARRATGGWSYEIRWPEYPRFQ